MTGTSDRAGFSRVWDLPTRLFHLGLIATVTACWWTYETDRMVWHRLCGYAAAGLLLFRLYWGLVGASTARFRGLLTGPRGIWNYLKGEGRPVVGHNPLGGWSVAALLSLLIVQVLSGLFALDRDDLAPGPLSDFVSPQTSQLAGELHAWTFDALLFLIGLHIAAIVAHLIRGDNLIGPMLHGRKRLPRGAAEVDFAPRWLALPGLALAVMVVAFLSRLSSS
jgi:cytochrome b